MLDRVSRCFGANEVINVAERVKRVAERTLDIQQASPGGLELDLQHIVLCPDNEMRCTCSYPLAKIRAPGLVRERARNWS